MDAIDWGDEMAAYNAWFAERGGWTEEQREMGRGYRAKQSLGHEHLLRHGSGPGTVVPGWDGWNYGGMDPGLFPLADRR